MKKILTFAALALMAPVSQVNAAELIGDTIACQQINPSSSFTCDMSQAIVGPGREFTVGTGSPFIGLNFIGDGLRIRNASGSVFSLGETIIRLENLSQIFTSFRLTATNIGGFTSNDITLTSGALTLDFRGTRWGANDGANLDLTAAAAVPEPSAWMMLILGFGAVGAALRSQRRRSVRGTQVGSLNAGRSLA